MQSGHEQIADFFVLFLSLVFFVKTNKHAVDMDNAFMCFL